ncbi:hypothetical protein AK812_SmicGene34610 [Symbiodinium microadriaticum]|uniref:Uncharacterized protein n=1 Tax=Symbiodinium microadriaticum TaxID=2951 RepID=A0A1Q9CNK3_SYMMI|nr:hypothetical protein AK812_SmicGene34610 [Symbiodinium microadriaticum]
MRSGGKLRHGAQLASKGTFNPTSSSSHFLGEALFKHKLVGQLAEHQLDDLLRKTPFQKGRVIMMPHLVASLRLGRSAESKDREGRKAPGGGPRKAAAAAEPRRRQI